MPPKAKKGDNTSKKTEAKKKDKIIEDKTFGLKNKKGKVQQKYIKTVVTQVQHGGKSHRQMEMEKDQRTKGDQKKLEKQAQLDELNKLFKPVQQIQKVAAGVDPKSVLCAFFKSGQCKKGDKCKFSHDLNIERKTVKRNVYDDGEEGPAEMTEEELAEMVEKKHGQLNKSLPPTAIICKFFLDAVENNKYGWFWNCKNGDKCHYRHALPAGFVLKKDQKKDDEGEKKITIEELIERERAALGDNLTRVTLETFLAWKDRKRKEKIAKAEKEKNKKKKDFAQGKMFGISGRQMFEFNPDMIADEDDEDGEVMTYTREESDDEGEDKVAVVEIDLDAISKAAVAVDEKHITVSKAKDRSGATSAPMTNGIDKNTNGEASKLGVAGAIPDKKSEADAAVAATTHGIENGAMGGDIDIDENLFDDEDLDALEDDLDTLELDA
ncbi:unnamed protein product [Owenia fusiformis]|uniref:Uncharacterized protein n=1 Tax=Owenia fusiformis TaxID=6347 RepID=A0A8J1UL32_OWEFU|nr:unnamed protein product [Owenia fusiformis]